MEKFNYQAVFKIDDETQVIFVGSTDLSAGNLYLSLSGRVDKMLSKVSSECVSFVYQPLKPVSDESKA